MPIFSVREIDVWRQQMLYLMVALVEEALDRQLETLVLRPALECVVYLLKLQYLVPR